MPLPSISTVQTPNRKPRLFRAEHKTFCLDAPGLDTLVAGGRGAGPRRLFIPGAGMIASLSTMLAPPQKVCAGNRVSHSTNAR